LARYIHLNPVRAGIVDRPSAYPWSSYSAYSHLDSPGPSWLTRNFVLSLFGETPVGARAALRAFTELQVEDGEEDWARPVTPDSEPELGSYEVLAANGQRAFAEQAASSGITLEKILCAVSSACFLARSELSANVQRRAVVRARSLAGCIVNQAPHLTLEQLGAAVGRDASTLSRAADNIARRLATDPELQDLLTKIERSLSPRRD
jgi:hypothetical protein